MSDVERPLGSRYFVGERIGRGGMGEVFLARDAAGTRYAVKILRSDLATDPQIVTRFVGERTLLLRVRSPHLVRVHDLVVEGDTLAVVMDLVVGPDLRVAMSRVPAIPPAEIARIGAQTAAGLAAAHAAGVVHRDIKPENVLLDRAASPPTVRLTDFGIARLVGSTASTQTGLIGTAFYMAPEAFTESRASVQSDLYSLGILLYELASGSPPFVGDAINVMDGHLYYAPGRPAGVPDVLWDLIAALLIKDPARRPRSTDGVRDLLLDLAARLQGHPPAPRMTHPPQPQRLPPTHVTARLAEMAVTPTRSVPLRSRTPVDPVVHDASETYCADASLGRLLLVLGLLVLLLGGVGTGVWYLLQDDPSRVGEPQLPTASSPADPNPVTCLPGIRYKVELSVALDGGCREDVRRVQTELARLGFFGDDIDGKFGRTTDAAVRAFQQMRGLFVDGKVGGAQTWPTLFPAG